MYCRCRRDHRCGDGGDGRTAAGVSQWPSVRGVARIGAAAAQHRRQDAPGTHHPARRCVSAHTIDPRRQERVAGGSTQAGTTTAPIAALDHRSVRPDWLHKTLVAIANKHARIIWALLVKGEDFDVQRLAATTA